MKKIMLFASVFLSFYLLACSKPKPNVQGNFTSTKCDMQCSYGKCKQVCTSVKGNFSK